MMFTPRFFVAILTFALFLGLTLGLVPAHAAEGGWTLHKIGAAEGELQPGASEREPVLAGSLPKGGEMGDASLLVAKSFTGNLTITARVAEFTGHATASVAGVTLRAANEPGAPLAYLAKRPGDDWITLRWRDGSAAGAKLKAADNFMGNGKGIKYLRLERKGETVTALRSPDGLFWFKVGEKKLAGLPETLQAGVFVSSSNPEATLRAAFADVELAAAGDTNAVVFQKLPPDSPSLQPFVAPLRLNAKQLQPASPTNPRGYDPAAPWPGVYKNPDPLIPELDIPGPDGLIYPNFKFAGVQGGIPTNLPVAATIPANSPDFAAAVERAIAAAGERGGVIQLEAGVHTLKRPLIIRQSNIVLRGKGPQANGGTTIRFEYGLTPKQLRWFFPTAEAPERTVVCRNDTIEVQADLDSPVEGTNGKEATLILKIGDKQLSQIKWNAEETGRFRALIKGQAALWGGIKPGDYPVTAEVTWKDGSKATETRLITLADKDNPTPMNVGADAAIHFAGHAAATTTPFAEPFARGATSMRPLPGLNLAVGDFLLVHAGPSDEWVKRVKAVPMSEGGSGFFRHAIVQIKSVSPDKIEFNQPLRIPFEVAKSSWLKKLTMVQRCGVEDLAIEQTQKVWTHGVFMTNAANCWVKNVRVEKAGRNAFWTNGVKWIEARDLEIHDAWFKGGGGTAYVGWEDASDCLMEGVKSSKLRHGPNMQWSANGCVIRNGEFHDSDAQFHAGWPNENLVENCVIHSVMGSGSYGYGFFIVGPESHIHGPMGPRNVLFNNDISSGNAGLWFGGSNEGYQVLYNRFTVGDGPAVLLKAGAFDHRFIGNVFVTKKPVPAAVMLVTPDCTGNEFVRNKFHGVVDNAAVLRPFIFAGAIPPAVDKDNEFLPYVADAPRPKPSVPSLFEWQRSQK